MRNTRYVALAGMALACLLVLGMSTTISAQGRGAGAGRGAGSPGVGARGAGNPGIGSRPTGTGVNRGISTASERSGGRSDGGLGTASERSGGRSDKGLDRARARDNSLKDAARADKELSRYQGLAERLGTTPEELRDQYVAARAVNPDLNFGRFVAANTIAKNLNETHPQITTEAILIGLSNGMSIGQSLRDLGLSSSEAKEAEKNAKRQIEASRRRS